MLELSPQRPVLFSFQDFLSLRQKNPGSLNGDTTMFQPLCTLSSSIYLFFLPQKIQPSLQTQKCYHNDRFIASFSHGRDTIWLTVTVGNTMRFTVTETLQCLSSWRHSNVHHHGHLTITAAFAVAMTQQHLQSNQAQPQPQPQCLLSERQNYIYHHHGDTTMLIVMETQQRSP